MVTPIKLEFASFDESYAEKNMLSREKMRQSKTTSKFGIQAKYGKKRNAVVWKIACVGF